MQCTDKHDVNAVHGLGISLGFKHQRCYSPPPLKESHPEIPVHRSYVWQVFKYLGVEQESPDICSEDNFLAHLWLHLWCDCSTEPCKILYFYSE